MASLNIFGKHGSYLKTRKLKEAALTDIGVGLEEYQAVTAAFDRRNKGLILDTMSGVVVAGVLAVGEAVRNGAVNEGPLAVLPLFLLRRVMAKPGRAKALTKILNAELIREFVPEGNERAALDKLDKIANYVREHSGTPQAKALEKFMHDANAGQSKRSTKTPSVALLNGLAEIKRMP